MPDDRTRAEGNVSMLVPEKQSFSNASVTFHSVRSPFIALGYNDFLADYSTHENLLATALATDVVYRPMLYLRTSTFAPRETGNSSSRGVADLARSYFNRIAGKLEDLRGKTDEDGDEIVETGAIDTALTLVASLEKHEITPPDVTWHGGDAVVMLWTLGDTTYAITATDGEFGYVVRRRHTTLRIKDSVPIQQFRLEDMR